MKKFSGKALLRAVAIATLLGSALTAGPARAEEMASEASIRDMLSMMKFRETIDQTTAQMRDALHKSVRMPFEHQQLNDAQRAILERRLQEMDGIIADQVAPEKLEPFVIDLYRRNFTQSELDASLQFYRTPAGASMLRKLPTLMQQILQRQQDQVQESIPRIRKWVMDTGAELKAARTDAGTSSSPAPAPAQH